MENQNLDILSMMEEDSKSAFTASGEVSGQGFPENKKIQELNELVLEYNKTVTRIDTLSAQLQDAESAKINLTDSLIPDKLRELGIKELKLSNGLTVKVKPMLFANIAKDRQGKAFDWLIENGLGDIIKSELVIYPKVFGDGALEELLVMVHNAIGSAGEVETKMAVHPSTLKATIKEQLDAGNVKFLEDETKKLFGIHEINRAVIK